MNLRQLPQNGIIHLLRSFNDAYGSLMLDQSLSDSASDKLRAYTIESQIACWRSSGEAVFG